MHRSIVTAAVLGVVLMTGTPALAAAPEIQQKSCEANGGTFTRDQGTKTCTTTSQTTFNTGPVPNVIVVGPVEVTGISSRADVVAVTTSQSQKGNGAVTTTESATVLSSTVTPISCISRLAGFVISEDSVVCVENGLFLQPLPLGPIA